MIHVVIIHVKIFDVSFRQQHHSRNDAHHQPQEEEHPEALTLAPFGPRTLKTGEAGAPGWRMASTSHGGLPARGAAEDPDSAICEAENTEKNGYDEDCDTSGNKTSNCHFVSENLLMKSISTGSIISLSLVNLK